MNDVTRMIEAVERREGGSEQLLTTHVYHELRHMARDKMRRERAGGTLNTTALVHEAYLRLVGGGPLASDSRTYFYGAAAEAMRRILVERARRRGRLRHGGGLRRVSLNFDHAASAPTADVVALSEALEELEAVDARKALTVKLRYFVGLSTIECADAVGVSERTCKEDWRIARMWLNQRLRHDDAGTAPD